MEQSVLFVYGSWGHNLPTALAVDGSSRVRGRQQLLRVLLVHSIFVRFRLLVYQCLSVRGAAGRSAGSIGRARGECYTRLAKREHLLFGILSPLGMYLLRMPRSFEVVAHSVLLLNTQGCSMQRSQIDRVFAASFLFIDHQPRLLIYCG